MNTVTEISSLEEYLKMPFSEVGFTCRFCNTAFVGEAKEVFDRAGDSIKFCHKCSFSLFDNEFIFECEECGKYFTKDAQADGSGKEYNEILCEKCFEDSYNICADCGTVVRYDKTFGSDDNDRAYCQKCWEDSDTIDGMGLAKEAKLEEMGF